jgi:hypothetical protein
VDRVGLAPEREQPPARSYTLTREGRRQPDAQVADWTRSSGAVERVLRFAYQGG